MTKRSPFKYCKTTPEIIRLAVICYLRFSPSLRNVEDLLHERGIDVSHEAIPGGSGSVRCAPSLSFELRR